MFGPCFDMDILVSFLSIENILRRTSESGLLCFNCFLVSCNCLCSLSLLHGAAD